MFFIQMKWCEQSPPLCFFLPVSLSQPVDYENKRMYTLKVEGSNPHIDPQFIAWGPYKDEATIKVCTLKYANKHDKTLIE